MPIETNDPVLTAIFQRRSIRRYTGQPVEREKLEILLHAAMAAPNACNSQPWEFVVVTEPENVAALRDKLYGGKYNAPAAIVVCGNVRIANNSVARFYWAQDCSAAIENMLIAAVSLGLGTVWIGAHPQAQIEHALREALNIPEHVTPLGVVYVGYADEQKRARTQYDAHRVYWECYEPRKPRAKDKRAKFSE